MAELSTTAQGVLAELGANASKWVAQAVNLAVYIDLVNASRLDARASPSAAHSTSTFVCGGEQRALETVVCDSSGRSLGWLMAHSDGSVSFLEEFGWPDRVARTILRPPQS